MDGQVSLLLEVAVKPGEAGNFTTLMEEMADSARGEPGTLAFEWSTNDDESVVHIYERYADSAAAMAHIAVFGEKFAGRFVAAIDVRRFDVYGTPSEPVKAALGVLGPVFMKPSGGFAR